MALSVCKNTEQFEDVINTLIDAVDKHVNEIRTKLVLSVLLSEGMTPFTVLYVHFVYLFYYILYSLY